jgi:hypothetical protein
VGRIASADGAVIMTRPDIIVYNSAPSDDAGNWNVGDTVVTTAGFLILWATLLLLIVASLS